MKRQLSSWTSDGPAKSVDLKESYQKPSYNEKIAVARVKGSLRDCRFQEVMARSKRPRIEDQVSAAIEDFRLTASEVETHFYNLTREWYQATLLESSILATLTHPAFYK